MIECVRLSRQENRQYLAILDMHKPNSCNLKNLSEHLLNALLKSRQNLHCSTNEQMLRGKCQFIVFLTIFCMLFSNVDFELTMDWNCAEVAKNLLFNKSSLNITELFRLQFSNVLIRLNREQFVEIFLSNGFQVHKFLTPSRLNRLYRIIHENEFFHTVCWESALGQSSNSKQSKFFIESELNWLIEFCTGIDSFVNTGMKANYVPINLLICLNCLEELHLNSLGQYANDLLTAERKALALLTFWAVMQNRYELVKVLWKYSDHPVHLALIISMFFERLSYNVMDTNTKADMKQKSKLFADYANGVLDRCYNENISQAYNVLRESIKDWNYMTAVDIAARAQKRQFLAHPCCQKWLTNTFQGKIRVREITWGFFTIPAPLKILLCSLLVFPMYIWIQFSNEGIESNHGKSDLDDEFDVYENMFSTNNMPQCSKHEVNQPTNQNANQNIPFDEQTFDQGIINQAFEDTEMAKARQAGNIHRREVLVKKQPPIDKMIQLMWTAPITKFYTSQLFYIVFLVLISLATLYPNCGSLLLDSIVCLWIILFMISSARHTYFLLINYSSISIYPKIIEIILIGAFVLIFAITRIFGLYLYPLYGQKVVISLALLYFYYRLISIYLPISPTLGPLLHRFRLMITVDFVNYMRITLVILISNSIIISALEYPYRPITINSVFSGIIHQGLLSLLTMSPPTDISNLTYCPSHAPQ